MDKMRELIKPMADDDYKKLMSDLGMPDSKSLLSALKQVANHTAQYTLQQSAAVPVVGDVDCYDAGLLSDFGGGNVEWWQDYIRAELARAHEFYASQMPTTSITAAELDALRKDAERYRWLRDGNSIQIFGVHESWTTSHRLDAVIDAAIERYANDYL